MLWAGDLAGFCFRIWLSSADDEVLLDDSIRFVERAIAAGVGCPVVSNPGEDAQAPLFAFAPDEIT
jgi:acetyl esterase/lipase